MNCNDEIKLFTVSAYIKYFLNKIFHRCSNLKTPFELVTDKLIKSIDGLHTSNSPRQIYPPKYTLLENYTVVLDVTFQKSFQESSL